MRRGRVRDSLLPPGLTIERVQIGEAEIVAVARSRKATARCRCCGSRSKRVHDRLAAVAGGLAQEALGDLDVGDDVARVELRPGVLPQRLRIDTALAELGVKGASAPQAAAENRSRV